MTKDRIWRAVKRIYSEYKILFLSYAALALICLAIVPSTTWHMLRYLQPLAAYGILKSDESIYIPLLLALVFIIINVIYRKKIEFKERLTSIGIILLFTLLSGFFLRILYWGNDAGRVAYWSNFFMAADKHLFGTYPAFWFFDHYSYFFERIIIFVYTNITIIITSWIIFLFIYEGGTHLKRFVKMYFIAFAICFPLWMLFPAICPAQMYLRNILNQPRTPEITALISKQPPSKYLDDQVLRLVSLWTDRKDQFIAVSTFPSMHAIWGVLLAASMIRLFRKKKYGWVIITIGICIAVANIFGAFYLLQHYVVDLIAGVLLAFLIIKIPYEKVRVPGLEPGT